MAYIIKINKGRPPKYFHSRFNVKSIRYYFISKKWSIVLHGHLITINLWTILIFTQNESKARRSETCRLKGISHEIWTIWGFTISVKLVDIKMILFGIKSTYSLFFKMIQEWIKLGILPYGCRVNIIIFFINLFWNWSRGSNLCNKILHLFVKFSNRSILSIFIDHPVYLNKMSRNKEFMSIINPETFSKL